MERIKQFSKNILIILITLLIATGIVSITSAEDLGIGLDDLYTWMVNESPDLFKFSGQQLIDAYGRSFNMAIGSKAQGSLNRHVSCLSEPGTDAVNAVGAMIRFVIDVDSNGNVQISTPKGNFVAEESDKEAFNTLACVCESSVYGRNHGTIAAPGWAMCDIIKSSAAGKYGITTFGTIPTYANRDGVPKSNRITEGKTMRIVGFSLANRNGVQISQERIIFGEAVGEPGPGILRLVKVDEDTEERLPGVQFQIKRTTKDKEPSGYIQVVDLEKNDAYMKKENETLTGVPNDNIINKKWELRYTNKAEDATVFETDTNGEIYIYGLMSGAYVAEEIKNPIPGYKINEETANFSVANNLTTATVKRVANEYTLITLELNKVDMITNKPLDGAGFIIKTDQGEWVRDYDSEDPYDRLTKNESDATTYRSEDGGKIVVKGLPPDRNYTWVETVFPENPQTGGTYKSLTRDVKGIPAPIVEKTRDSSNSSSSKNIPSSVDGFLFIGDSITQGIELYCGSGSNVTFRDLHNTKAGDFLNNNKKYLNTNTGLNQGLQGLNGITGINIMLGTNQTFDITNAIKNLKTLIEQLHGWYPNVPIYVDEIVPLPNLNKANVNNYNSQLHSLGFDYVSVIAPYYGNIPFDGSTSHPTKEGYKTLWQNMKQQITSTPGNTASSEEKNKVAKILRSVVSVKNKPVGIFRKVIKGTNKGIQGVPFEFREYSIAVEYPELMEGFTVGGASYKGSLADEHCTYKTCGEVDTKVAHHSVASDGTSYTWYTCSLHNLDGSHADQWEARRAKYNDDVKWANEHHAAREKGVKEINEGTSSEDSGNNSEDPSPSTEPSAATSASPSSSASSTPSESASPSSSASLDGEVKEDSIREVFEDILPDIFSSEYYSGETDTEIKECTKRDSILPGHYDGEGHLQDLVCSIHEKYGSSEEMVKHIEEWNAKIEDFNKMVRFINRIYTVMRENKTYTIEELSKDIYPELFEAPYYAGETETQLNLYAEVDTLLRSGTDNKEHCALHLFTGTREGIMNHVDEWNDGREEHNKLVKNVNKLLETIKDKLKAKEDEKDEEKKSSIKEFFKLVCPELFTGDYYSGETDDEINLCTKDDDVVQSGFTNGLDNFWTCFVHKIRGTHDELVQHRDEWIQGREEYNKLVKFANKLYAAMKDGKKHTVREISAEFYPELFTGDYYEGETENKIKLCYNIDLVIPAYTEEKGNYRICTRHYKEGTLEELSLHTSEWNQARNERNKLATKINNMYSLAFTQFHLDTKETTSRADSVREVTQLAASDENAGSSSGEKRNNLTDEKGEIDISPLVPDDDDGRGKFQYREINEGMENPYFNNDHPDWTDFDYLGKTIVEDERRRMDIEGLIWVERAQDQKGGIDDPETVNGIYDEGLDQLLYPVEVCLKNGNTVIGQGVVTADGRYRIRVGGKDGSTLKYVTDPGLRQDTYVEFTYNGMKYQSVFEPTLENEENGSKAMEKAEDRQAFNERYTTITSNNGEADSNRALDGTIINYEKLEENGEYAYKRRVLYEGQVDGVTYPEGQAPSEVFGGKDSDPIGDGVYSGLQKRPKANEVDKEYTIQQASNGDTSIYSDNVYTYSSKTGGDKYQIKADTKTAGYQGINNYNIEDDKIEHVNLGVYERIQPDIAIVNDIERVKTHINNEEYIYQYGSNTSDDKQKVDGSEKPDGMGMIEGRFQSNVNYKYKRYIKPEQIQVDQTEQNKNEQDQFEMTIYYRTEVINQSSYLYMQPEIRTQYDAKYEPDIRDATDEIIGDKENENKAIMGQEWQLTSPLGGTNANIPEGYQERYNTMTNVIAPGETKVFYTAYTLHRKNLETLIKDSKQMYFFNNIEVNAYTTTWMDEKGQERLVNGDGAYAAIDEDSAPGNSKPSTSYVQQEDKSWKPSDVDPTGEETFEDDNDIAPVFELNREDPAKISGTVYLDDIIKDDSTAKSAKDKDGKSNAKREGGTVEDYLGNGKNGDAGDIPVAGVKVELVELLESGDEILETAEDGTKTTKVQLLDPNKATLNTDRVAQMITDDTGTYSFVGFIPGEYIIKFTWGQNVVYKGIDNYQYDKDTSNHITTTYKVTTQDENGNNIEEDRTAYVQQYKSTVFDNEERYSKMTDMKGDTTTKNRWYIDGSNVEYSGKSNAIDDMEMRKEIDNDILNTGNNYEKDVTNISYNTGASTDDEKMLTYPDLEEKEDPYNVFAGRATSIVSRTPAFDVSQQGLDKDKDEVNEKNIVYVLNDTEDVSGKYAPVNIENLDFGISERPKQNMELEKRIERVSVRLANGQTLIDANVTWKDTGDSREQRMEIEDIKGEIEQVVYPKNSVTSQNIGTLKLEVDKEILQGSTMEVTYKYNIINESNLDYVISDEGKTEESIYKASLPYELQSIASLNRYYKYGNAYNPNESIKEEEVEMSPSIIIDYLDNAMAWKKYDEVEYHENDLWEEVTEDEDNAPKRITNLLYDGRFTEDNPLYDKNKDLYNKYLDESEVGNLGENLRPDLQAQVNNIYKFYRTILRDTTDKNMDELANNYSYTESSEQLEKDTENQNHPERYKGQVYLRAKEMSKDDVKFVASKELSDTDVDLNFYNVAEVAQIHRTGGAIPEEIIPGDTDPTVTGHTDLKDNPNYGGSSTERKYIAEFDGDWASEITITPPTGDSTNYNYIIWTAVGIVALAILGIGTLGIKKVLAPSKIEQPKEDSMEDK